MDPVNRALWWRQTHPDVVARTRWFMNWHEYYSLLLSGRPVVDWSDAGAWAVYDVASGDWSQERIAETGIDRGWLPEVRPNATPIGKIEKAIAQELGLPPETLIVTGAWDAFAAAVGSAGVDPGVVALACGTWHSFTVPMEPGWPDDLVREGMNVCPHPGPTGFGILGTNPNGMSVIDWARELFQLSIPDLERGLSESGPGPSPVATDAALTPLPHRAARTATGATFTGLTLATTRVDLVQALLEAIASEFALTLRRLRTCGVDSRLVRATGGGSRIAWWLQLHADVCGIPVEVVEQEEPGAFGAALLAGVGAGVYPTVSQAVADLVRVGRRFEPNRERGALYAAMLERLAS
jgi:xylulokinase